MAKDNEDIKDEKLDVSSDAKNSETENSVSEEIEDFDSSNADVSKLLDESGESNSSEPDSEKNTVSEYRSEEITEAQQKQYEKLGQVKEKISKILNASNVEIVDENIGDEYDLGEEGDSKKQQQQDYDSLKALFGDAEKNKKNELTLTIDDYDYTYAGQYVDEFDLMHVKGIKHIKLQRKHSKHFKKIIVAAVVVVAAGLAGLLSFLILRQKPVVLQSVVLNQTGNSYYINQKFDYTGLYFIAKYSDGRSEKIPLKSSNLVDIVGNVDRSNNEIKFIGGQRADLTFSYGGVNIVYTVEIKHKNLEGIEAYYSDGLFNLKQGEYLTQDYLKLLCNYGDYGKEEINFSNLITINVDGQMLTYSSSSGGYLLSKDVTQTSEIVVRYNGFQITFGFEENAGIIK